MPTLPPLNALRAFEIVARLGGYAAAAEELNVTPAAIGQQVRQLEALVGGPLFERDGRAMTLTERGSASRDRLTRAFALLADAADVMRNPRARTTITIAGPFAFLAGWLGPRIGALTGVAGGRVNTVAANDLATAFDAGADIAVMFEPRMTQRSTRANDASLRAGVVLMDETLTPVATPQLAQTITTVDDLQASRLLEENTPGFDWRTWLSGRGEVDAPPTPTVQCDDPVTLLQAACSGAGVALVRKTLADDTITAHRLAPVLPDGDLPGVGDYVAVTRDAAPRQAATVSAVLSWLRAAAAISADAVDVL